MTTDATESFESQIVDAVKDRWRRRYASWPIVDANENLPDDSLPDAWARVSINELGGPPLGIGSMMPREWDISGQVFVQCFVPKGSGAGVQRKMIDFVRSTFGRVEIPGVEFEGTFGINAGTTGVWDQRNAVTPFRAQYTT